MMITLLLVVAGLILIFVAFRDASSGETDLIVFLDTLGDWDISRDKTPLIFWMIVLAQFLFGVGVILFALLR